MEIRDTLSASSRSLYCNIVLSFHISLCSVPLSWCILSVEHSIGPAVYPKSISRSRSKSREIIAGQSLYVGGF